MRAMTLSRMAVLARASVTKIATVGQRDQADVVTGFGHAIVLAGCTCLMRGRLVAEDHVGTGHIDSGLRRLTRSDEHTIRHPALCCRGVFPLTV
jgi:hypothetical protein